MLSRRARDRRVAERREQKTTARYHCDKAEKQVALSSHIQVWCLSTPAWAAWGEERVGGTRRNMPRAPSNRE